MRFKRTRRLINKVRRGLKGSGGGAFLDYIDSDSNISSDGMHVVDTTNNEVVLTVSSTFLYGIFSIFDIAGTFNINKCSVVTPTGIILLTKKNNRYRFIKTKNGDWSVFEIGYNKI